MAEEFNLFDEIGTSIDKDLALVVEKTAFDLQANIQAMMQQNGQIDTGFMWDSVYTVTSNSSNYGKAGTPPAGASYEPSAPKPDNKHEAYVGVAASYAVYQNYGTWDLPPRPFWEPALEQTMPSFDEGIAMVKEKFGVR